MYTSHPVTESTGQKHAGTALILVFIIDMELAQQEQIDLVPVCIKKIINFVEGPDLAKVEEIEFYYLKVN